MASESWSAFTLQATSSCAVEAATCLAEEMSFSSLAWPWTEALAASQRLLVAAATIRACRGHPKRARPRLSTELGQVPLRSSQRRKVVLHE